MLVIAAQFPNASIVPALLQQFPAHLALQIFTSPSEDGDDVASGSSIIMRYAMNDAIRNQV